MKLKRAILTGFAPFGPYTCNPTADLAQELDGQVINGTEIRGIVLPATYWTAAQRLWKEVESFQPDRIVSIGLASAVPCIQIEVRGKNLTKGKYPDANGLFLQEGQLEKRGPYLVKVNSGYRALKDALSIEGIEARLSINADAFICNALLYLTMRRIFTSGRKAILPYSFIHAPWTANYLDRVTLEPGKVTVSWDDLVRTAIIALTR